MFFDAQVFIYNFMRYIKLFEDFTNNNIDMDKVNRFIEMQKQANKEIDEDGQCSEETMQQLSELGDSLTDEESSEVLRLYYPTGEWVTAKDIEEEFGFYSDLYKDENGVRPHGHSAEQLADWCNQTFKVEIQGGRKMIVKKDGSL